MKKLLALIALLSVGPGYAATRVKCAMECVQDCRQLYDPKLETSEKARLKAGSDLQVAKLSKKKSVIQRAQAAYDAASNAYSNVLSQYSSCLINCRDKNKCDSPCAADYYSCTKACKPEDDTVECRIACQKAFVVCKD